MIKLIKNEQDYHTALQQVDKLIKMDPVEGTKAADKLELYAFLVETYEKEHFPLPNPDPLQAIRFRMEQQSLSQKDLVPMIGSKSKVSEVLSGKKPLNLRMIKSLHQHLGIPLSVLVQNKDDSISYPSLEWSKFPIKEMFDRGWFVGIRSAWEQIKERQEELLHDFFNGIDAEKLQEGLCRQNIRSNGRMNPFALLAWKAQVVKLAQQQLLPRRYSAGSVDEEYIHDLLNLSYLSHGPGMVGEFLGKTGIHFVIVPHLRQTHLDGAAIRNAEDAPIIALTVRHDRLDNFWFTLLHELAHLVLHLDNEQAGCYIDDLDSEGDAIEKEADEWARNLLVPSRIVDELLAHPDRESILSLAGRLRLHQAILAGRIRWEKKNYRILSDLVGNHQVRSLLLNPI